MGVAEQAGRTISHSRDPGHLSFHGRPPRRELQRSPGDHLVIVHYKSPSKLKYDWVYNEADIENARVVWARDMGRPANKELTDYFSGRRAWLVEPGEDIGEPPKLSSYPPHSGSGVE